MDIITQKEKILYIGIDVHKDTYSLCCFDFQKNELSNEMTIKATTKHMIKYMEAVRKNYKEEVLFVCGYEAGPTGYGLCRGLWLRCNGSDHNVKSRRKETCKD